MIAALTTYRLMALAVLISLTSFAQAKEDSVADSARKLSKNISTPVVSSVLVSKVDAMTGHPSERIISAGEDVYVRWTAADAALTTAPITLEYSFDDVTWTSIASSLSNEINNCESLRGEGAASSAATGCFKWINGSPADRPYSVRVIATNSYGLSSRSSSKWINLQAPKGPSLTVQQGSPRVSAARSLVISGTCSGGSTGSDGVIYVSGAGRGYTTCSSTNGAVGTWTYVLTQTREGTFPYTFTLRDKGEPARRAVATFTWTRREAKDGANNVDRSSP